MHVLLSSVLIDETSKISKNRPEMAREDTEGRPRVDRGLTQGQALGAPRAPWRPYVGGYGALAAALHQMYFFSGEEKCLHFFSPDRGDCRS